MPSQLSADAPSVSLRRLHSLLPQPPTPATAGSLTTSASLPLSRDGTSQLSSFPALSLLSVVSGLFPPKTTHMASLFSSSSLVLTNNDWEGTLGTPLKSLSSMASCPQHPLDYLQPAHAGCGCHIWPIVFSFIPCTLAPRSPFTATVLCLCVFFLLVSVSPSPTFLPVYLSASLPQGPACLALPTPETTLSSASILALWR